MQSHYCVSCLTDTRTPSTAVNPTHRIYRCTTVSIHSTTTRSFLIRDVRLCSEPVPPRLIVMSRKPLSALQVVTQVLIPSLLLVSGYYLAAARLLYADSGDAIRSVLASVKLLVGSSAFIRVPRSSDRTVSSNQNDNLRPIPVQQVALVESLSDRCAVPMKSSVVSTRLSTGWSAIILQSRNGHNIDILTDVSANRSLASGSF